jgi:hypothetical protein
MAPYRALETALRPRGAPLHLPSIVAAVVREMMVGDGLATATATYGLVNNLSSGDVGTSAYVLPAIGTN